VVHKAGLRNHVERGRAADTVGEIQILEHRIALELRGEPMLIENGPSVGAAPIQPICSLSRVGGPVWKLRWHGVSRRKDTTGNGIVEKKQTTQKRWIRGGRYSGFLDDRPHTSRGRVPFESAA
jgi:hypothetical protein